MQNQGQKINRAACQSTIDAVTAKLCIQCTDAVTQKIGSFLAVPQHTIRHAISPVFTSLVDLYTWCRENSWVLQPFSKEFPVGLYRRELQPESNDDDPVSAKYVVLNEHTLGYLIPEMPNAMGILHASILRGSPHNDLDGWTLLVPSVDTIRAATPEDFRLYRVHLPRDYEGNDHHKKAA